MAIATLSTFIRELSRAMAAETLSDQSDRELVEQFLAAHSEAVFLALVRRHGPMVYRVCWRVLHHEHDAEDAFQATFLVLAQNLQSVRKRASLASWLHGVAHRVALKAKAQATLRRRHEQQAPAARAESLDSQICGEIWSVLDAELVELPDKWRMPLVLCYLEGRTQDEAAGQLGWSKNTLRRRLEEARTMLGQRLSRRGIALPAALSAVLLSDSLVSAALPSAVTVSTAAGATRVAAGEAVASVVSGKVAALINGTWITTAKIKLGVLLLVGLIGTAVAISAQSAAVPEPPPAHQKRTTPVPVKELKEDNKADKTAEALKGRWLMTLRAGFEREVTIRPLGENRFSVENAARFSGVYELRQSRLVLSKPADPAEKGFEWEIRGVGEWALVAQPPPKEIGQNYLGATLKRFAGEDRQTKKTSTRLTTANVNDQPLSFTIKVDRFKDKKKGEHLRFGVTVKAKDVKFRLSPRRSAELKVFDGEEVVASYAVQAVERGDEVTYSFRVAAKYAEKSRFSFDEILGDFDVEHGGHYYWFYLKDFVESK